MARFGYDIETFGGANSENIIGQAFTCPENGIAQSITAYISVVSSSNPHDFTCAIYKNSDKSLIKKTDEVRISNVAPAWVTFLFSDPKPMVYAGVDYLLVTWSSPELYDSDLWYDINIGTNVISKLGLTYDLFPATLSDCITIRDRIASIYCTYTPVGPPELCSWIEATGGLSGLTITDVFELVDSYLNQTPPTGYSFIPTLQNLFGVIDYYLGFNGDAATGCDFFP